MFVKLFFLYKDGGFSQESLRNFFFKHENLFSGKYKRFFFSHKIDPFNRAQIFLFSTINNYLIHPWKLWASAHSLINFHMNPLEKYWNVEILQKQSKILGSFYGWIQVIYLSDLVRVCRSCNQLKSERKNALGKKQRALHKPS